MYFSELNLNDDLLEAISYMGFEETTPVQELAIPKILAGKDLIACAQTGTGKTAAFILPVMNRILEKSIHGINTLVIVPTRELAVQIDQQIQGLAYFAPVNSIAIYGGGDGQGFDVQRKALTSDTHIVVATPGKLLSHLNLGYVKIDQLEHLILDEADRMLDMGFLDDIRKIISFLPEKRQTLMFSATMPPNIRQLSKTILKKPDEINISLSKPAEGVLQASYLCYNTQKIPLLKSLIKDKPEYQSILIFCSTKKAVSELARALETDKYKVQDISSDLEQSKREEVLLDFKSRKTRILVATDVLSRGIDIKDIDLIINYDVPEDAEDYVHRVGRTARAKGTGVALTLVNPEDMFKVQKIEKLIGNEIIKLPVPPELGEGPVWKVTTFSGAKRKPFRNKKKDKSLNFVHRICFIPEQKYLPSCYYSKPYTCTFKKYIFSFALIIISLASYSQQKRYYRRSYL
jgi:superfamily II DNA/RNA helicase